MIPASVINIGDFAFYHCDNLTNVTIGKNVTNIEERAFNACKKLKKITFLSPTTTIYDHGLTISSTVVAIYGFTGSTAESYVWFKHSKEKISLGVPAIKQI